MSGTTSPPPTYPVGTVVSARVQRLLDYGAEVTLDDGCPGIIRNRELDWDSEPHDPGEVLQAGQEIKALVLKFDERRGRLELSLRQAERDPWCDLHLRYQMGKPARGKVVRLRPQGAFVELEPAVDAFVSLDEIRPTPPERIESALWVGDTVEGIVTRIDPRQRHIHLSLRRRQEQLLEIQQQTIARLEAQTHSRKGVTLSDALDPGTREQLLALLDRCRGEHLDSATAPRDGLSMVPGIARVLLADDDPAFRGALQRLLRFIGYDVAIAETAEQAVALATSEPFDLVLIDLGFVGNGLSGIRGVQEILRAKPATPVVVVTGIAWLEHNSDELRQARELGARSALLKPILLAHLETVMAAVAQDKDAWAVAELPPDVASEAHSGGKRWWTTVTATAIQRAIADRLHALRVASGATAVTLFHISAAGDVAPVREHSGAPLRDIEQAKYTLVDSPIRDVMSSDRPLLISDISQNPDQVRHLQLLAFGSCLGVPVHTLGPLEYALFVFHPRAGGLSQEQLQLATATATAVGAALVREEAEHIMQRAQPLITIGQLSSALMHELHSAMGTVTAGVETLRRGWEQLQERPSAALDAGLTDEMRQAVGTSVDGVQRTVGLVRRYLDPRRREQMGPVDVNEVAAEALRVLEPEAATRGAHIVTELTADMPKTLTTAARLEQVFINVGLNAIQQMYEFRGQGVLRVSTSLHSGGTSSTIHVRFSDNGPGIHAQHVDRLGELGFTTRSNGTGLGLFIARGLLESLGGTLRLDESVMFLGTTFVVELPLVIPAV